MRLKEVVAFLNETLNVAKVDDHYTKNGLQVEGRGEVASVGFAVDACLESFEKLEKCDLIVVHHGLFWPSTSKVTGRLKDRIKYLVERDISLYSVHIPLDVHPVYGNNAGLLDILGAGERRESGIAMTGSLAAPLGAREIQKKIDEALSCSSRLLSFGPPEVGVVTACSGGGSSLFDQAVDEGAHLFLTGEQSHTIYHAAREAGIHVIFAGHYATETLGVRALKTLVEERLALPSVFAECPTDL